MEKSNSTTVWSQPSTEEQVRYFSKHAPKLRAYGVIQTIMQAAHTALAFASWLMVFSWALQNTEWIWLAPIMSGGALITLHYLFRVTWSTFWYDRLDDDPNTDSSVFIPVAIIALLLVTEISGAKMYLAAQVKPAELKETSAISSEHSAEIDLLEKSYANDESRINKLYKGKLAAITSAMDSRIRAAESANEPVGKLYSQRAKAVADIESARAAELEKALARYQSGKEKAMSRRDLIVNSIDTHNQTEAQRFQQDMGATGTNAIIMSVGLIGLIMGLGYSRVRINVKSGIMPKRNYTVMDAHGGVADRFSTAISDAFNRQSMKAAVALHRTLSPSDPITSFDGTVIAIPGTYNTFDAPKQKQPKPHQYQGETDDDIRAKVANKLMAAASRGEISITPEMLHREYEKARQMNGTYASAPIEQPPVLTPNPNQLFAQFKSHIIEQMKRFDNTDDPAERKEINAFVFQTPASPIVQIGKKLGLRWGVSNGHVVVGKQSSEYVHRLDKVSTIDMLDAAPTDDEDTDDIEPDALFKHDTQMFKQNIKPEYDDHGNVIGIRYLKKKGVWDTKSFAGVKAMWNIYHKRSKKTPTPAVLAGLDAWYYAMQFFQEGREVLDNAEQSKQAIYL